MTWNHAKLQPYCNHGRALGLCGAQLEDAALLAGLRSFSARRGYRAEAERAPAAAGEVSPSLVAPPGFAGSLI